MKIEVDALNKVIEHLEQRSALLMHDLYHIRMYKGREAEKKIEKIEKAISLLIEAKRELEE